MKSTQPTIKTNIFGTTTIRGKDYLEVWEKVCDYVEDGYIIKQRPYRTWWTGDFIGKVERSKGQLEQRLG